jgi:hypothetical protein
MCERFANCDFEPWWGGRARRAFPRSLFPLTQHIRPTTLYAFTFTCVKPLAALAGTLARAGNVALACN